MLGFVRETTLINVRVTVFCLKSSLTDSDQFRFFFLTLGDFLWPELVSFIKIIQAAGGKIVLDYEAKVWIIIVKSGNL